MPAPVAPFSTFAWLSENGFLFPKEWDETETHILCSMDLERMKYLCIVSPTHRLNSSSLTGTWRIYEAVFIFIYPRRQLSLSLLGGYLVLSCAMHCFSRVEWGNQLWSSFIFHVADFCVTRLLYIGLVVVVNRAPLHFIFSDSRGKTVPSHWTSIGAQRWVK